MTKPVTKCDKCGREVKLQPRQRGPALCPECWTAVAASRAQEARLLEAAALVESVERELSDERHTCSACGVQKYERWGEKLARGTLGSVAKKLRRAARDAARGWPTERDGNPDANGDRG